MVVARHPWRHVPRGSSYCERFQRGSPAGSARPYWRHARKGDAGGCGRAQIRAHLRITVPRSIKPRLLIFLSLHLGDSGRLFLCRRDRVPLDLTVNLLPPLGCQNSLGPGHFGAVEFTQLWQCVQDILSIVVELSARIPHKIQLFEMSIHGKGLHRSQVGDKVDLQRMKQKQSVGEVSGLCVPEKLIETMSS